MLEGKKFLFFDLDGVLTDTRDIHFQAFHESLKKFGIYITHDEHVAKYDGLPTKIKLNSLKLQYNLNVEQVLSIDKIKQEITITLLKQLIQKDEILVKLLSSFHNKFRMCVCSNARRDTLDLTLNQIGIKNFFEFTISQEEVSLPKPAPDIYLKALDLFQADISECLIIEDSPHGILAARNSGIEYLEVANSIELKNRMKDLAI